MEDNKNKLQAIQSEYSEKLLDETTVESDPIRQFEVWFNEAIDSSPLPWVNAMTLSTVSKEGRPSARIVLLKDYGKEGFTFYTNYESRKGIELAENTWAALTFYWPFLERQVRMTGKVEKVSPKESEEYFKTRPIGSQLGAWSSPQSEVVQNRAALDDNYQKMENRFGEQQIPRPEHWGGYSLSPTFFEFWQGRKNRLHDRISYELEDSDKWVIQRLAP